MLKRLFALSGIMLIGLLAAADDGDVASPAPQEIQPSGDETDGLYARCKLHLQRNGGLA